MKRIVMLVAVVGAVMLGGLVTSTASAGPWGPGYGCRHWHGGYVYGRPHPYRYYGPRMYPAPGVIISTPGIGIGVGAGYGYPAPYPAYGYGYGAW